MVRGRVDVANTHGPTETMGESGCQSTWFRGSWGGLGLGEPFSRLQRPLAYRAGDWREIAHRSEEKLAAIKN